MTRYIENIDVSFLILIYRITLYRWKNIKFFDISQYFTPNIYIFITTLPKNDNKQRKHQSDQGKPTV